MKTEEEMKHWLVENTEKYTDPKNSEEIALTRVGKYLYEKMFKNYTIKQWDMEPKELDASVMARIPVRMDFNDRYFSNKYEAQPKDGYTAIFEKMLNHPNITVKLNSDFFKMRNQLNGYEKLFYSGKVGEFFDYKYGKLGYRSLKFEFTTYDQEHYIPGPTVNYPNFDESFTRIVEYKYFTKQQHPKTVVSREWATWEGDPYYPVPTKENKDLYLKYEKEAKKLEKQGTYFIGRLANYKYINMDQAFRNALNLFKGLGNDK
jgi:UDP-galactopyranose mutase